jgi:ABC-2 type transport system permease protein
MNLSAVSAIARQELRIFRRDPTYLIITTAMPLIVIPVLKSTVAVSLRVQGFGQATGAEQVVPGQAVVFSFFLVGGVGFSFFREHGWHTWERLRASAATPSEIIAGKAIPWTALGMVQLAAVFIFGWIAYDLDLGAQPIALVGISLLYIITLVVLGIALVAVLSKMQQVNAVSNLGAIVFGAIGGAFVGISQLPGWLQPVAPVTPTYWIMRGYRSIFLGEDSAGALLFPAAILLGFAALFAAVALLRFRFDEAKLSWA